MKNSFLLMLLLFLSLIFSCQDGKRSQIISLLQEWEGKEIIFPENSAKICRIAKNERFTSVSPQ